MSGRRISDDEIAAALHATLGIQSAAAVKLHCSRWTVCERVAKSQKLKDVIAEEYEKRVDLAESSLFKAVTKGEPWAVRFTLQVSPYGRKRGYAEQTNVTLKNDSLADVPTEQIKKILAERTPPEDGGEVWNVGEKVDKP